MSQACPCGSFSVFSTGLVAESDEVEGVLKTVHGRTTPGRDPVLP